MYALFENAYKLDPSTLSQVFEHHQFILYLYFPEWPFKEDCHGVVRRVSVDMSLLRITWKG